MPPYDLKASVTQQPHFSERSTTAAYWFTSSTSFANPAITVARSLSDTFAGIAPADVPAFVAAQLAGAALVAVAGRWLFGD